MAYRESLLVDYLKDNPVWRELVQVFEEVWGNQADSLADQLSEIRDLYRLTDEGKDKVGGQLLSSADFSLFDRPTMVRICSLLGFGYPNVNDRLFSTEDYLRIAQNISDYYKEQGTESFIKFFSYCLNSQFALKPTWTEDYVTFLVEGDAGIGTPVWDGGTWYPTSHVKFVVDISTAGSMDPDQFRDFFYYIAPINLVLLSTVFQTQINSQLYITMHGRMRVHALSKTATYDKVTMAVHGRMTVRTVSLHT